MVKYDKTRLSLTRIWHDEPIFKAHWFPRSGSLSWTMQKFQKPSPWWVC